MRKKLLFTIPLLFLSSIAQPALADGQTGIDNYDDARRLFWREMYKRGGDESLYCGKPLQRGYNDGINIEHVFPMYWATKGLKCGTRKQCQQRSDQFNHIEADLHNMYPAMTEINDARGSLGFGIIPGEKRDFGQCDFEINGGLVEPRDSAQGEIARAALYMAYTYDDLYLTQKQLTLMQLWNQLDPPSEHEHWRNDRIESIQGNRNPFIDKPELADSMKAFR